MAKSKDDVFPPFDWTYRISPRWKRRIIIDQFRANWQRQQQELADWHAANTSPPEPLEGRGVPEVNRRR